MELIFSNNIIVIILSCIVAFMITYIGIPSIVEVAVKKKLYDVPNGRTSHDVVTPTSLYYDVNVEGTKNVLEVMASKDIKNIIFTSSVAIFGLNKPNPNEEFPADPFNHYGKSKYQAENVLLEWQKQDQNRSVTII
jgi:hypothetical protein